MGAKSWWTWVLSGRARSQRVHRAHHACMQANRRSLTLHLSALLPRLIKAAAAALDACLKPGHERRNRSCVCNWCAALFSRPLPGMSATAGDSCGSCPEWNLMSPASTTPPALRSHLYLILETKERIAFERSWTRGLLVVGWFVSEKWFHAS